MKKGFTLVELLAVILILGMISIIAVPSYLSINKSVNKGLYEAKVADIMSSSTKYAMENGILAFNVKDLISDGYINPDNETGELYDNYNNRSMVCDVVSVSIDANGNYSSKIINHDGACLSKEDINDLYGLVKINIEYYDKDNNKITSPIKSNGWVKAYKAKLTYSLDNSDYLDIDSITNISWYGSAGEKSCDASDLSSCSSYLVNNENVYSSEITLSLSILAKEVNGEYGSVNANTEININASVDLNMDVEAPTIDEDSIYVLQGSVSSSRTMNVSLSDGTGVGVGYFALYDNPSCTGTPIYENANAGNGVNDAYITADSDGKYYLLVRDKLGNQTKSSKVIDIKKIDTTKPVIKLSNYNGAWTKNKVTVNWSLTTGNIANIQSFYYSIDGGTQTRLDPTVTSMSFDEEMNKKFSIFAVDKAGNVSNTENIQIRIDRTPPTASFTISPTSPDGTNSWYKNSPTVSYSYNDAKSGIDKVMRCSGTSPSACGTETAITSNSVKLNSSSSGQIICIKAYDKVGNNKVYCSSTYKVDTVNPTVSSVSLSHTNGSLKVTATGTDAHSGIQRVEMKLDSGSYVNNGTSLTRTFTGVNMYANHTVTVRIIDNAGRVSTEVSKTISTVTVKFNPNGGSGGVTKNALPGTTYSNFFPGNPTRAHYNFNGWYNGSTKATTSMVVGTSSVTYNASWTIQKHTLDLVNGSLSNAKADVYINNKLVSSNVTDYCQSLDYGTTYKMVIKPNSGFGVRQSTYTGTLTGNTVITPSIYTLCDTDPSDGRLELIKGSCNAYGLAKDISLPRAGKINSDYYKYYADPWAGKNISIGNIQPNWINYEIEGYYTTYLSTWAVYEVDLTPVGYMASDWLHCGSTYGGGGLVYANLKKTSQNFVLNARKRGYGNNDECSTPYRNSGGTTYVTMPWIYGAVDYYAYRDEDRSKYGSNPPDGAITVHITKFILTWGW